MEPAGLLQADRMMGPSPGLSGEGSSTGSTVIVSDFMGWTCKIFDFM